MSNTSSTQAAREGAAAGTSLADELLKIQTRTRIVEGVAVTVTSGILLGALYNLWGRFTGKKKNGR